LKLVNIYKICNVNVLISNFSIFGLEKWDESLSGLLTLLQLIPPTAQGKGKGSRAKIVDARDLLVTFYKV
jgi:hypothetical protein